MNKVLTILTFISVLALTACTSVVATELSVTIDDSTDAVLGESFPVYITIENPTEETHTLTSIDVGTDYLENMTLDDVSHAYFEEWDMTELGFFSYDHYIDIAAGDSLEMIYYFIASTTGRHTGSLDVCIDTETDCFFGTVETDVE